jgi:hypothetical protein
MDDELTELEMISFVTVAILRGVSKPDYPTVPSAQALARLRENGLSILADRLETYGVGEVAKGYQILASPDLADPLLEALGLISPGDTALTLCYSPFGDVDIEVLSGLSISVMPLGGSIYIFEAPPETDPMMLQINLANNIATQRDSTTLDFYDADGKNLLKAIRKRLGPLSHGQVYALPLNPEDETRFTSARATISELVPYLLALHAVAPFEISRFPYVHLDGASET